MSIKITPQGEIVGGGSGHPGTIVFAALKQILGTDADGNVTIPEDATQIGAVGVQAAKINDPTGGLTIDAEARTAIVAIIDALEAFGISATVSAVV